ncbi:MAG: excinuclease ABC subunit C [Ignavibacteria bacterium RBG_16_34_14]|nr:MAG: excinuclease ABC subunit C [Ignavibacteria bacterium RBG_16_34_14]
MKNYFVYILTNKNHNVLYTGMTNNIFRRGWEHKSQLIGGFTKRYNVTKLVYYESFDNLEEAIKREKQLKAGSRKKKIELINKFNHDWKELYNIKQVYK